MHVIVRIYLFILEYISLLQICLFKIYLSLYQQRPNKDEAFHRPLILVLFGTKNLRMDQVKFLEDSVKKYVLGPFLNTLSHISLDKNLIGNCSSPLPSNYLDMYRQATRPVNQIRKENGCIAFNS